MTTKIDEYAQALIDQNNGGVCRHCHSAAGHYSVCPLLNRETAELVSEVISTLVAKHGADVPIPFDPADILLSERDEISLRGLGVKWEA